MNRLEEYIHFYLGCECYNTTFNARFVLKGLRYWNSQMWCTGYNNEDLKWLPVKTTKLLLRPMLSMTDEEKQEWYALMKEGTDGVHQVLIKVQTAESLKYLLDNCFDVFGLIEEGIAIDKTHSFESQFKIEEYEQT